MTTRTIETPDANPTKAHRLAPTPPGLARAPVVRGTGIGEAIGRAAIWLTGPGVGLVEPVMAAFRAVDSDSGEPASQLNLFNGETPSDNAY